MSDVSIIGTLLGPAVTATFDSEIDSTVSASLTGPTVTLIVNAGQASIVAAIKGPTVTVETLALEKYQFRWNGDYQGVPEVDTITEILVSALPDIDNPENDRTGWSPGDSGNVEVRSVDGLGNFGAWSSPQAYAIPHAATITAAIKGPTVSLIGHVQGEVSIIGTLLGPSVALSTAPEVGATIAAAIKGPTVSLTNFIVNEVTINAALSGPTVSTSVLIRTADISAALSGPTVAAVILPQGGDTQTGGIGFQTVHDTGGWNTTLHEYTLEDFGTSAVVVRFGRRMKHVWIIFDTQPTSGVVIADFRTAHRDVAWQKVADNIFDMSDDQDILLVTNVQATAIRLTPNSFIGGPITVRILAETPGGL